MDMTYPESNLKPNRHDRGWPKVQVIMFLTVTEQSWRYCIEPMGYRDTVWYRSGYVELICWDKSYTGGPYRWTGLELPSE
jgi:hypothetical protein